HGRPDVLRPVRGERKGRRPRPRLPDRGVPNSEAVLPDLLGDYLLDALDVVDLLALEIAPEVLQLRLGVSVGDVLIVAPEGIQALAQVVDQIMIMVGTTAALSDVCQFLLGCQSHDLPPFGQKITQGLS